MKKENLYAILTLCALSFSLSAQTTSDAILMPARNFCFYLGYEQGSFSEYWEGERLRDNQTIATVTRQSISPSIAYGVNNRLSLFASLPAIKTASSTPNGGQLRGIQGIQDLGLSAKYSWWQQNGLSILSSLTFSTPVGKYPSDYQPYSIGLGTQQVEARIISQYDHGSGLYVRGSGAYVWRGYTRIDRNFYYSNGAYYSDWMDVPSALQWEGVLGAWLIANQLKLEFQYMGQHALSGDDIRLFSAPQPTNNVAFQRIGGFGQYYPKQLKGLGVVVYAQQVLAGKNTAQWTTFGGGLTYQFAVQRKALSTVVE